ncbi:MAG: hypothetical protein ABIT71_14505, partial [Vicinamibacteraceae bacterium]
MPFARLRVVPTRLVTVMALTVAALSIGALPDVARAQARPNNAGPAIDILASPARPPIEIGATMGVALIVPTFGGTVSVPVARRASVEFVGQVAPWMLDSGDDTWFMTQVQLRVPFRDRPRARRSLIVGLTSFTVGDRYATANGRREWDF